MNTVATYKGVEIVESFGYFYPAFDGNIEYKNIKDLKRWIRKCYLPAKKNLQAMKLWDGFLLLKNMGLLR